MSLISFTLDTSHSAIDPCRPLEQSPFGNNLRHALTAVLSSTLDRGKNAVGGVRDLHARACACVRCEAGGWQSSKQVERTVASASMKVLFRVRLNARWECRFGHAPPLQEFGEILMSSIRNRIQSCEDKLTCAC